LNNEIEAKEQANRKPKITNINEIDEKTFSKMQVNFKSRIKRTEASCYKLI